MYTNNIPNIVPEWKTKYTTLQEASSEQKTFYKFWHDNITRGICINLDDNAGYIFAYLSNIIKDFILSKNIDKLMSLFEVIRKGYPGYEDVIFFLDIISADAYFFVSEYDKSWEIKRRTKIRIDDVLYRRSLCSDTSINCEDILSILGSRYGLTSIGKEYIEEIKLLTDIFLNDFQVKNNTNIIDHFINKLDYNYMTDSELDYLKQFFQNESEYLSYKEVYCDAVRGRKGDTYNDNLFFTINIPDKFQAKITKQVIPAIVEIAVLGQLKIILRESENTIREEINIPRVGEGWKSETNFYQKILKAFPEEEIIHHGRPFWLSPQHIDIYFPHKNIAIEYQGRQHQEPVEYFGGEDSFEKQQERDKRKKSLCDSHNTILIYVYENYNFEELCDQIRSLLV
jgi:hypothetical protein